MKVRSLVLGVALLLSTAGIASAQSTVEQQAALQTINDVGQRVWTDLARADGSPDRRVLYVAGWGFECSSGSQGTVSVIVDGLELATPLVYRIGRVDVRLWAMSTGACDFAHTPYLSGINVFIDATALAPGLHTATLKISNEAGVSTVSPKSVAFIVPNGK